MCCHLAFQNLQPQQLAKCRIEHSRGQIGLQNDSSEEVDVGWRPFEAVDGSVMQISGFPDASASTTVSYKLDGPFSVLIYNFKTFGTVILSAHRIYNKALCKRDSRSIEWFT